MVTKDTDRLCLFVRPWRAAQWADHPHYLWVRTANACVADSLRCGRHLPGEKEKGIRLACLEDGGTLLRSIRTIVERENMLPRCPRRAQQHIRLHEVTRIQWRRLALEFLVDERVSKKESAL